MNALLPASLPRFPDMVEGWEGPALSTDPVRPGQVLHSSYRHGGWFYDLTRPSVAFDGPAWHYLDPRLRPVRSHLVSLLAVGLRCPACACGPVDFRGRHLGNADDGSCADCNGTGYLRPPQPVRHLLGMDLWGDLPAALAPWSPWLVACSIRRVSAGMGVVARVMAPAERLPSDGTSRIILSGPAPFEPYDPGLGAYQPTRGPWSWYGHRWRWYGTDASALSAGFALHDPGAMVLPFPDGADEVRS